MKRTPAHPFVTLRSIMGLQLQELGLELALSKNPVQAAKLLGGCQNGSNSLRNKPASLRALVEVFGVRPESVLEDPYDGSYPRTLLNLSSSTYTPLWFLAWVFTAQETPPPLPKETGGSDDVVQLGRRIDRADALHVQFRARDYGFSEFFSPQEFLDFDHDWFLPLDPFDLEREKPFFGQRVEIAKRIYGELAAAIPWEANLEFRISGADGVRTVDPERAWLWEIMEREDRLQLRALANLMRKRKAS